MEGIRESGKQGISDWGAFSLLVAFNLVQREIAPQSEIPYLPAFLIPYYGSVFHAR